MPNQNVNKTFSIQQVSELTGLSKQVIRKWEERYGVIQPERLENGYRIYTNQEVATLKRIHALTENGTSVKQAIAMLSKDRSTVQASNISISIPTNTQTPNNYAQQAIARLLEDGYQGKDANMLHILQQAHHTLGVKPLIYDVIVPFLHEVGNKWYIGEWEEFKEALASQVIRDFLANLRRNLYVSPEAPVILGSCLPNERHEIPLHILMVEGMLLGYRTIMLGASPAPRAIQESVEQTNPKVVVLSAITHSGFEDGLKTILELDEFAGKHPHIKFYIGGYGAVKALANIGLQHIMITNNPNDIARELRG